MSTDMVKMSNTFASSAGYAIKDGLTVGLCMPEYSADAAR